MQSELYRVLTGRHCLGDGSDVFDHDAALDFFVVDVVDCVVGDRYCPNLRHAPGIGLFDVVRVHQSIYQTSSTSVNRLTRSNLLSVLIAMNLPFPMSFFKSGSYAKAM